MHPNPIIDHIAFLTSSLDEALAALAGLDLSAQPVQTFENEGTRECYLGAPSEMGRLLLIEAVDGGPYADALAGRGPGLQQPRDLLLRLGVGRARRAQAAPPLEGWSPGCDARRLDIRLQVV